MALAHGLFMLGSGSWPLLSMRTFEFVTGPKKDDWLVKTVGTLIALAGVQTLIASAKDEAAAKQSGVLAMGVAGALGYISFHYAMKRTISRIYLLDTLVEVGWLVLWARMLTWKRERRAQ